MSTGNLSALQERVLLVLARVQPPWTLTGGGALVGFYTQHRATRDLDLFFRGPHDLGGVVAEVQRLLREQGLTTNAIRTTATFGQLEVHDATERVIVDLVADPTPLVVDPTPTPFAGTTILVEDPHQLLVNKLCALLGRSELRDLQDVRALLAIGGDLARGLADCPRQDGGFSPLTFAYATNALPIERLGVALGVPEPEIAALVTFRNDLVDRVLAAARPEP